MSRDPRWTWKAGLDRYALGTAAVAGGLTLLLNVALQLRAGKLSLNRSVAIGTVGTISGFAARYGGVQIQSLLTATRVGQNLLTAIPLRSIGGAPLPSVLGGVGGGLLATAVFAYGSWLLGQSDQQTAHRQLAAGAVGIASGVAFRAGTFGLAATVGTASTGTAIASLSGAAANNATFALLGGGSLAAGGWGVWGGMAVLSGGTAIVGIAATMGVTYLFHASNSRSLRTMLKGRLQIVADRVRAGNQVEWQAPKSAS